jgi:hypothetical protein
MANEKTMVPCISCGDFVEVEGDVKAFIQQNGRCAACQGVRKLAGKFGSLLVQGVMTQREVAELKREFYQLYQIDKALETRKAEFMQRAMEEMNRVVQEVEAQIGQPVKELRSRKAQLEAQLKTFMEESKTSEMVVRDLLVELKEQIVNQGNRPQYTKIVEELRQLLKWSQDEMETFVRQHYSQPQTGNVMTIKPLPPGRRKKVTPPVPGKPVASRAVVGSIADDIVRTHKQAGGGTFDMSGRSLAGQQLYAVPLYPERTITLHREPTARDIDAFLRQNEDLLSDARNKMGTWFDSAANEHILDVVVAIPNRHLAVELGKRYNQRAIFDLGKMAEIPTGGTGAAPRDMPEPAKRLPAPAFGDEGYAEPSKTEEDGILAFHTSHLDLPTMAVMHTDFVKSGARICKVTTPEDVFIFTGSRVKENGLYQMVALQMLMKGTLKVADVENKDDGSVHVLIEGQCVSDANTLRAFLAERIDGHEITETYYDSPTRVAVELRPVEKIALDPMQMAISFFNQMAETVQNLMQIERKRSETANILLGETTAVNQMDLPDNTDDLSLKYERSQPAGGQQGSFGSGTRADGGLMGPNDRPQSG